VAMVYRPVFDAQQPRQGLFDHTDNNPVHAMGLCLVSSSIDRVGSYFGCFGIGDRFDTGVTRRRTCDRQSVATPPIGLSPALSEAQVWVKARLCRMDSQARRPDLQRSALAPGHWHFRTRPWTRSRFLTELDEIKPLHLELVYNDSSRFGHARLYLESLLRQSPPIGDDL
jgi:hypothetical protein